MILSQMYENKLIQNMQTIISLSFLGPSVLSANKKGLKNDFELFLPDGNGIFMDYLLPCHVGSC